MDGGAGAFDENAYDLVPRSGGEAGAAARDGEPEGRSAAVQTLPCIAVPARPALKPSRLAPQARRNQLPRAEAPAATSAPPPPQRPRISMARESVPRLSEADRLMNAGRHARPGAGVKRLSVYKFESGVRESQPRASWVAQSATTALLKNAQERSGDELWRTRPKARLSDVPLTHPRKPQHSRTYIASPFGEIQPVQVTVHPADRSKQDVATKEAPRDRRASLFARNVIGVEAELPIFHVTSEVLRKLAASARRGQMRDLLGLLDRGCDVNATDEPAKNSPLIWGAQNGHVNVCRACIERGANVNWQNRKGNTALHFAVAYAYSNVADLLLEAGADPDITNLKGATAWETTL